MSIRIQNISKRFNGHFALENINFNVEEGELVSLLGPSGSGKTTLLRIIAGLESPTSGEIFYFNELATSIPIQERKIGFVFQHYALFKHMTVAANIEFPLKIRKVTKQERQKKVQELLELVQLENLAKRYPHQLSGGQKQRVALARALASQPKVLLLDEPFGALDANVRKELRRWLRNLHKEIRVTTIMVTHDQEEAFEVSDKVVILNKGKLEQMGTPDEVFHNPANPFVIKFLGNVNIFHGRLEQGKWIMSENGAASSAPPIYVRPFEWEVSLVHQEGFIQAKVLYINAASSIVKLDVHTIDNQVFQVDLTYEQYKTLNIKKEMDIYIKPKDVRIFEEDFVI
ncbi:MAG: sulfate/molybdate ABC transporter ATP-binding protein [Leptospiraceae bacterium]|nr:sulfate/molybdate ABC transporter ATP-binding protein [Leptospiraceae bacterium]